MKDLVVVAAESNTEDMEIAKNNDPVVAQVSHDDDRKATATDESIQRMTEKKNLIKVSYHKKPFNYYLNLAKAYVHYLRIFHFFLFFLC